MGPGPDFPHIIRNFQLKGEFRDAALYGEGHINKTYVVILRDPGGFNRRYILQCINQEVFKKPEEVMHNIVCVTDHIRKKIIAEGGDPDRKTIRLVQAKDGNSHFVSRNGDCWRMHRFIEGARTYLQAMDLQHYYHSAKTFGEFLNLVSDIPASNLYETIPDFHNTPKRYQLLISAVEKDQFNRAQAVKSEFGMVAEREAEVPVLFELKSNGDIPVRVTHNDTKIDNVMIDDETGEGICAIDLDTVMPGLSVFDFGDTVRSGTNTASEDEPDLSKVNFSLDIYDHLATGFLEATRELLTPAELENLAFGAKIITLEQGIRFLTDYLEGDNYYITNRPDHNLDRARTQLKMVSEMEEKFGLMKAIIEKHS